MSKDLQQALMVGAVVVAAGWWFLSRAPKQSSATVASGGLWFGDRWNQAPDRILNPGENGAIWV